jgi:N-acetylglutamate synthase-like GNAT family acetyltransferase
LDVTLTPGALMQISYLVEVPDAAGALIPGLIEHWRYIAPEDTVESRESRFKAHMNRDVLPIAWVAHSENRVLGTAALRIHDLPGREDLTPWLGGVFVLPEFRRRGIASTLCKVVEGKALALGFPHVFLFTIDQQSLYTSLGWRTYQPANWRGHTAEIMLKQLPPVGLVHATFIRGSGTVDIVERRGASEHSTSGACAQVAISRAVAVGASAVPPGHPKRCRQRGTP